MATTALKVCGTGVGNWPKPGDPDNSSILRATPAFGGIDINWSLPLAYPEAVAYVNIMHSLTPNASAATYLVSPSGNFHYDKRNDSELHYYWIEIVSVNGTKGDWIGPASARAKPLIADIIEQLTDKIDRGVLAQSLKADLDKISVLNTNLLNEIKSREDANISLAQALADTTRGVAQALTFIHTEINSRVTADQAIAEKIDLVAVTAGGDYAAVIQTMRADITNLSNDNGFIRADLSTVGKAAGDLRTDLNYVGTQTANIGALWSVQVNVNRLVGGFGIYNNGDYVEAGFDVDVFWVGRTQANKRKPFMIVDGVTYLDDAVIRQLVFSKLRDEAGTFIVENGKVKADYITIGFAQIQRANIAELAVDNFRIAGEAITTPKVAYGAITAAAYAQSLGEVEHDGTPKGDIIIPNFDSGGALIVFQLSAVSRYSQYTDTGAGEAGGGDAG